MEKINLPNRLSSIGDSLNTFKEKVVNNFEYVVNTLNSITNTLTNITSIVTNNVVIRKAYIIMLTQTDTDDPVVNILANTFQEEVLITRTDVGTYHITTDGLFTTSKCTPTLLINTIANGNSVQISHIDEDHFEILTKDDSGVLTDGLLNNFVVEINIYA